MTQRQLAEKYDGPGCSNISPFYEWLPLLLLTQLHGQLLHYYYYYLKVRNVDLGDEQEVTDCTTSSSEKRTQHGTL